MLVTFAMLLLMILFFLLFGALVRFSERVIAREDTRGAAPAAAPPRRAA
jgi:hypothetical protein